MKTEPTAELRQAAAACWQMFVSLCDVGFTEHQALIIVGNAIQSGGKNQ